MGFLRLFFASPREMRVRTPRDPNSPWPPGAMGNATCPFLAPRGSGRRQRAVADLNIVRKAGPTLWPWLIGLVVLGLLIWGISELVNTDRDNATMAEADADVSPVATAAV